MRKTAFCFLCSACLLMAGVTGIPAQTRVLKVEVPFEFQVLGKTLPPGTYLIDRLESILPVLALTKADANKSVVVQPLNMDSREDDAPSLTFDRVGDTYFLRMIKTGYLANGYEFPKSNSERELTARIGRSETVQMAATLR